MSNKVIIKKLKNPIAFTKGDRVVTATHGYNVFLDSKNFSSGISLSLTDALETVSSFVNSCNTEKVK